MATDIDKANAAFWDHLCGTWLAQNLGIKDHNLGSLRRFDQAYLDMYPYLLEIIEPELMAGGRVLEIGLGYGTLGQQLADHAQEYVGLDIAAEPVGLMNHRLHLIGRRGQAIQGSCLQIPLPAASFDFVVSIGCFHHTGNVQGCIDEAYRVLRPGGTLIFMVYNQFSLRQWLGWPRSTFVEGLKWLFGQRQRGRLTRDQIKAYDSNTAGEAAPETVLLAIGDLKRMLRNFQHVKYRKRNCDSIVRRGKILFSREFLLKWVGPLLGLDIYVVARKAPAAAMSLTAAA